jgi:hypothetical protein
MKPPHDYNPTTQRWRCFATNMALKQWLFEYMKLVEVAIVAIIRSAKNECTFSTLNFMKSKLRNRLTINLGC